MFGYRHIALQGCFACGHCMMHCRKPKRPNPRL
jgi:heterodisulfide reductase subunit C